MLSLDAVIIRTCFSNLKMTIYSSYRWMNPGLRLVSARAYDYDLEIQDTAADKNIEFKGATRGYVKAYVEAARRAGEAKPVKAD